MQIGEYHFAFYRGRFGGFDYLPFIYWTKHYKELNWGIWLFSISWRIGDDH